jgi:hypothetical protein
MLETAIPHKQPITVPTIKTNQVIFISPFLLISEKNIPQKKYYVNDFVM